MNLEIKGKIK